MPARIREATYSSERVSTTTDSTPSAASRWESSIPAGPAPTIATWVRRSGLAMVSVNGVAAGPGYASLPLVGIGASARPMPRAATWSAATSFGLSRFRLGTTMPSAATTSPRRRIGTPTEQAPRLISSTVVA